MRTQAEIEEQIYIEVSEREARRVVYRPRPSFIRINLFSYAFTLVGLAAAALIFLAKANHWWGLR